MARPMLFLALCLFSLAGFSQAAGQGAVPQAEQMQATMQARMQAMHEQMARIQATRDPAERKRLMQEHMQEMHEGMMMMGQMMHDPEATGSTRQCAQDDTACRLNQMQMQQQMMSRQMGMMQQMMQHMMDQMIQGEASEAPEGEAHDDHR